MSGDAKSQKIIGIDIGGANIKLADTTGRSVSAPFAMWRQHRELRDRLEGLLDSFLPPGDVPAAAVAATLTGELADCFETRREGVQWILTQLRRANSLPIYVASLQGQFLSVAEATRDPWQVAASNWFALASWLACAASSELPAVLVDIGSTTIDIVPMTAQGVATVAKTDRERLMAGQLLYTGMERTPVASVIKSVELSGGVCPVMAECFATTVDAYCYLRLIAEDAHRTDTADGRPLTHSASRARLARMIGEDGDTVSEPDLRQVARAVVDTQAEQVAKAIEHNCAVFLPGVTVAILLSGHGEPLFQRVELLLLEKFRVVRLSDLLSEEVSRSAPAFAVAQMLQQQLFGTALTLRAQV